MSGAEKGSKLATVRSYYHTVKHLSLRQIVHRIKLLGLRRVDRRVGQKVLAFYQRRLRSAAIKFQLRLQQHAPAWNAFLQDAWDTERHVHSAQEILKDRYTFLNETLTLSGRDLWVSAEASQLWRYHVHYFEYVADLAVAYHVTGKKAFYEKFADLASSWIEHNPPGVPDAWHPYPLSLRVVNWLYACCFFAKPLSEDGAFRTKFENAIALQLDYLTHHMEHDVRGNHLLKNAKALALGGIFFTGGRSTQWRQAGLDLLSVEVEEQVLPDGGHFERSLLYHLIVLQDCAETSILLRDAGLPVPIELAAGVRRMTQFVHGMLQPDGDIPLFGDAELIGAPRVKSVLALAEAALCGSYGLDEPGVLNFLLCGGPAIAEAGQQPATPAMAAYPQTGYYVFRQEGDYLAVDCGEPCPSYLPAHAHCDMLSYELSLGGLRFVVDAGTYEYRAGEWRQHFRSTAAHNTVVVNGLEQSRPWGSFRLAERATARTAQMKRDSERVESFTGSYHTPYDSTTRFVHQRSILWVDRTYWVVVDLIRGGGRLHAANQILFSPSCRVSLEGNRAVAEQNGRQLTVIPAAPASATLVDAWYSPHFGVREKTQQLVLSGSANNGSLGLAYALKPSLAVPDDLLIEVQGDRVFVADSSGELTWVIPKDFS